MRTIASVRLAQPQAQAHSRFRQGLSADGLRPMPRLAPEIICEAVAPELGRARANAGDGPHLHHRYAAQDPRASCAGSEATATRFGRIDAVIANAGILSTKKRQSTRMTPRSIAILAINVKSRAP